MSANNDWKERLGVVFSTNPNFSYSEAQEPQIELLPPAMQQLRIRMERAGRGGKTVTVLSGFVGPQDKLQELCRILKNKCGIGGSAKDGVIILQGDLRSRLAGLLHDMGYAKTR